MNRKNILPFFLICFVGLGLSVSTSNCVDNLNPDDGSTYHDPSVTISGDYYRNSSGDVDIYKCSKTDCGLSGSFTKVASYSVSSGSHSFSETLNNLNAGSSYGFEVRIYGDACEGDYATNNGFFVDVHSGNIDSVNPTSDTDDDDITLSMDYTAEESTNLIMKMDGNTYTSSGSGGTFSKALTKSVGNSYSPDFELRDPDFPSDENLIDSDSSFFDILALTTDYSSRSPNNGADVKGSSVDFSFDFQSNKDGTVQLYMDGNQINSWSYGDGVESTTESYSHSETGVSDGTHNWHIEFSASETSETSSSSTDSFEYQDDWPASVDSVSISPDNPNRTDKIDISTTVSDYDNNINDITYEIFKGDNSVQTGTIANSDGSYTLTDEYEIPDANENYEVNVTVDDDQSTDSRTTSFTVDNHNPSVDKAITEPSPIELGESVDVFTNVSDIDKNIDNVTLTVKEGSTVIIDDKVMSSSASSWDYEEASAFTADNDTTYTVSITVNDIFGQSETGSQTVEPNVPPKVNFTISDSNPNINESFNLDDSSSDTDGNVVSYDWDFGNGDSKTSSSVSYNYSSGGDKQISLTVTDDQGSTNTTTKTIHVNFPPEANFTYTPTHPNPGEIVEFQDVSTDQDGSVNSITFTFPNGQETFNDNPTYEFSGQSNKDVEIEASDDNSASSITTRTIDVNSDPNLINFSFHKNQYSYKDEAYVTANVSDEEVGVNGVNFTVWAGNNKRFENLNGSIKDNGKWKSQNFTADLGLTYFNATVDYVVDSKGLTTSASKNISFYISESPPNIESSRYDINRKKDTQGFTFGIENHDKIIETWRGEGDVREFTNETLRLNVTNPIDASYNVTNNESLVSNTIDGDLSWKEDKLIADPVFNNTPGEQRFRDGIKINNSGNDPFDYLIKSSQLNQNNISSMSTSGRVFGNSVKVDGPQYQGDWISNNKSNISVGASEIFIQNNYNAQRDINLTETRGINWSDINLEGYAPPGKACDWRYESDKNTNLDANADKQVTVDYLCDTGKVSDEIIDSEDKGSYTLREYEATLEILSEKTSEKTLLYEFDKDKLPNWSGKNAGSLDLSVNGESTGLTIEDRINTIRLTIPNDFGNSSLHRGNHTFKMSWTTGDTSDSDSDSSGGSESGNEVIIINESNSPPEPEFEIVQPEDQTIEQTVGLGSTVVDQFRIQNIAGEQISVDILPQTDSTSCNMVNLRFGGRTYDRIDNQDITGSQTGFGSFVYVTYEISPDKSIAEANYNCDYVIRSDNGYAQTLTFNTTVVESVSITDKISRLLNTPLYQPSESICLSRGIDNQTVDSSNFSVTDDTTECEREFVPPTITGADVGMTGLIVIIPIALFGRRLNKLI